jgi:hypothetical protein
MTSSVSKIKSHFYGTKSAASAVESLDRHANRGHVSLGQLKVMSAIEHCRTAALGGHVARCRPMPSLSTCTTGRRPKASGEGTRGEQGTTGTTLCGF